MRNFCCIVERQVQESEQQPTQKEVHWNPVVQVKAESLDFSDMARRIKEEDFPAISWPGGSLLGPPVPLPTAKVQVLQRHVRLDVHLLQPAAPSVTMEGMASKPVDATTQSKAP
eukprot:Em0001g2676a